MLKKIEKRIRFHVVLRLLNRSFFPLSNTSASPEAMSSQHVRVQTDSFGDILDLRKRTTWLTNVTRQPKLRSLRQLRLFSVTVALATSR